MSPNVAAERAAVLLRSLPGLALLEVWLFFLRFSVFSLGPSIIFRHCTSNEAVTIDRHYVI